MSSDKDTTPLSTPDAPPVSDSAARPAPDAAVSDSAARPAPDAAVSAPVRPAPVLPAHSLFRAGREEGHDDHHDDPHDDHHDDHHDHPCGAGRAWHDEADHSMADFDLGREIDARFDRNAWAAAASSAASSAAGASFSASLINAGTEHDDYFPEDERSSMDWESDHSMTDFDLREELFNRLGEAPPEEAPSERPAESSASASASAGDPSGEGPADPAHAPADADDGPHDDYYPEDERSSLDWEDDHSMAGFDLEQEVAERTKKAANNGPAAGANGLPAAGNGAPVAVGVAGAGGFPAAAGACGVSIAAGVPVAAGSGNNPAYDHDDDYFPEDERCSMDWEGDHSCADAAPEVATQSDGPDQGSQSAGSNQGAQSAAPEAGYIHPGLAASLSASFAYAQHGLQDDASPKDSGNGAAEPAAKSTAGPAAKSTAGPAPGVRCPVSSAAADDAFAPASALAASGRGSAPAASGKGATSPASGKGSGSPASGDEEAGPDAEREKRRPFDDAEDDGEAALSPSSGNDGEETKDANALPAPAGGGVPPAVGDDNDEEEDDEDEEEEDGDDKDEAEDDSGLARPMSLRDHLVELRKRITRAFLWMVVGFIACYPVAEEIFKLLFAPLTRVLPNAGRLIYTSPPEAFFTYMKVAFVAGIFLASPMIFYQIWAFIAPGLYKEEKAHVVPVAIFSALFFICGGAFCYFVAFPFAFEFFMSYSTDLIVAMPALSETLSFVLQLLLAFGLIFELPLFVFFLARLGIVTAAMMRKFRRYSILANVIIAAILTPPDVMSQMLMAGPLILLYEFSILIAAVFGKKKPEPAKEEEDEDDDEEEEEEDAEDDSGDDDEDEGADADEKAPAPAKQ